MFQKLFVSIRNWLDNMIKTASVKSALGVDVAMSSSMSDALEVWADMYAGQASWLTADVKSLGVAASVSSEIARSVTIEMSVEITGSARADYLQEQVDIALKSIRRQVEYGVAFGGLVMKPYIEGDKIPTDFVRADTFYPVGFDGAGLMVACVFTDQVKQGDYWYTRLEYHNWIASESVYEVENAAFKSSSKDALGSPVSLSAVDAWADLKSVPLENIKAPLFGYFKNPLANNVDADSPLGVSAYSRAVGLIEQADRIYSDMLWEFKSGARAIYVDELAFDKDSEGKSILRDKRLYRRLDSSGTIGDGKKLFEGWTPEFRDEAYSRGLNNLLKQIENNCGLSRGTLSDADYIEKSATEIKSSKQRSAATIKDTQKALEAALIQLVYGIDVLTTLEKLAPKGDYEITFDWDDSIIVDADAQMMQDRLDVASGLMTKTEYRVRNYGESEDVAKEKLAEIKAEQPSGFFEDE